ncbi:uncharacterized protein LOC132544564 [Ylistrum balloti]|uniref:uncharacterized protein LOC132544564 n=1 Tax=Ylistrum balloti TaxID=509963 RepID=UPI002905C0CC|nr:uncharacterized protein LOC132544564 [Ylistrum balloti]
MPIQYSCVVYNTTVLCSYQTAPGPFEKLLASRLSEISTYKKGKNVFNAGNYVYYTITENDVTFLCTVTADVTVMQSYAFLIQVKTLFWQTGFGSRDLSSSEPHELDAEFVAVLDTQMELYSSDICTTNNEVLPPDNESTASVTLELAALTEGFDVIDANEVKEDGEKVEEVNMIKDNLKNVIRKESFKRSEKIEELEFFVEKNTKEALAFRENARRANWFLRKKNRRISIMLGITISVTVLVIIVVVILLVVGVLG